MAAEKYPLNPILTPLNREERLQILENWQRITRYFNSVEGQIKLLAGGKEIEELLQSIETAITNAKNVTTNAQTALDNVTNALSQLNTVISNANAATNRANDAADDANILNIALTSLKGHLETLQNDLTGIVQAETQRVTNEGNRVQAEIVRVDAESLRISVEGVREQSEVSRVDAEVSREQSETARTNEETERDNAERLRIDEEAERIENENSRISAEVVRINIEQERVDAESTRGNNETEREGNENVRKIKETERLQSEDERITNEGNRVQNELLRQTAYSLLTELLQNMESLAYDYAETYNFPNFVSYNGSTFIALKEVQGITPIDDGINYRLVAQRGVDGTGAVSSVNGLSPEPNGNVQIAFNLINTLTSTATDAALTAAQGRVLKGLFDTLTTTMSEHTNGKIASEAGMHGVRYFVEKLEVDIDDEWVEISTGGALNVPNVSNYIGASATDGNAINVSWVNPTNAEFKRVELYASTSDISNVKIEDIANVATRVVNDVSASYTHPTSHGEQVYFKIFAIHEMVGDRYSEGLAINVVAVDTEAPGNLTNIHVANDNGKFTLSWVNPIDADLNKVKVVMNESNYPTSDTDGTVIYEGTGTSIAVDNLTNDQSYYIRFFVSDIIGNTNSSTEMQTVATPVDIRGIVNLTIQSNLPGTQFTLNWTNPTDATYVKTEVYASTSDLSAKNRQQCLTDATLIYSSAGATTTHVTTPNQTYYFKVFAEHSVNGVTRFDSGVSINKQAIDTEPPSTITNFVGKSSDAAILLTWVNPTDTDFQKVVIRYKTDGYPTSSTDGQLAYDGSATTANVTGLTNDVAHYFRAFAFDTNGNINSATTNQQVTAQPSGADDKTNAPGPKKLIGGTIQAGYFGRVAASELFTGPELALAVGMTAGTAQHDNTDWLKFAYQGKILFRPMKAIRHTISWDNINSVGCVFGTKTVAKNGVTFKVRLMKGSTVDPAITANDATNTMKGSEWNKLMLPIHEQAGTKAWAYPNYVESDVSNWGIGFTDTDLLTISSAGNGSLVWCQEVYAPNTANRVCRGYYGVSSAYSISPSDAGASYGWAPVLEVSAL